MAQEVEAGLYRVFEAYAAFGDRDGAAALDSFKFMKLLRESELLDTRALTPAAADLVFTRAKQRDARKLSFDDFIVSLGMVADVKYPGDPDAFSRVVDAVLANPGPAHVGTSPTKPLPAIYQKLTSPLLYTGSHVHRFEADGRGRGLAGRDTVVRGGGTVGIYREGQPVRELADMLRPGMRGGTHISSEEARRRAQASPKVAPHLSPRRAPPSSAHFGGSGGGSPGSSAPGSGGTPGRSPLGGGPAGFSSSASSSSAAAASPPPQLRVAAGPPTDGGAAYHPDGGGGGGGDLSQLQPIFEAFCLFGSTGLTGREGEMTSAAFAKLARECGIVGPASQGKVPPASVDVAFTKARGPDRTKRTIGYDQFLYALQLLACELFPEDAADDPLAATAQLAAVVVSAGGPALNVSVPVAEVVAASALGSPSGGLPPIFSKLTNPHLCVRVPRGRRRNAEQWRVAGASSSLPRSSARRAPHVRAPPRPHLPFPAHSAHARRYTGSHTHRFDENGRGRGKAGREYVPGVDDNVAALADILRPGH
jgi:hypothetical protein